MWITITKDRIKPKEFISEIHVDNVTNNIADILISVGQSIKRRDNGELESKIPKTGIEPMSVDDWFNEMEH